MFNNLSLSEARLTLDNIQAAVQCGIIQWQGEESLVFAAIRANIHAPIPSNDSLPNAQGFIEYVYNRKVDSKQQTSL
jgi:hypothetical protein